jgi:hypothetical protein
VPFQFIEMFRSQSTAQAMIVFRPSESFSIFNVNCDFCDRDGRRKSKEEIVRNLRKILLLAGRMLPNFQHFRIVGKVICVSGAGLIS